MQMMYHFQVFLFFSILGPEIKINENYPSR